MFIKNQNNHTDVEVLAAIITLLSILKGPIPSILVVFFNHNSKAYDT